MNLYLVLSSHLRLSHPRDLYLSFAYQNPLLPTCHMPRPSHPSWFNCWNYLCAARYNVLCFYAICVSPPHSSLRLSVSLRNTCAIVLAELLVVLPLLSHLTAGPAGSTHLRSNERGSVWLCGWNRLHMNMHVLHRTLSVERTYSGFGAFIPW